MPSIIVAANAAETEIISIADSLICSAIGFAIVFAVLLILMGFIGVMSKVISIGNRKPATAPAGAPASKPVGTVKKSPVVDKPAPSAVPEGAMQVTLGGKKHTVTVTEKKPRFTVTLNGKSHAVDVEEVEKEAAE